ncbi:hypothetical protein ACIRBX_33140 [Kitasatospora sp. NPDC096147]|uniref:hypothetical protein n=1 Tax=Kitasatospora sp. NPDC096147 TaxID=3364093 RepID=UPI003816944E
MAVNSVAGVVRSAAAPQRWLRQVLGLDAVVTGGNGLAYAVFAGPLGELLGVSEGVLREIGVFLIGYAALVAVLAGQRRPAPLGVKAVVDANLLWVVLSITAMLVWFEPTTAGLVWIPMQAATVAGFAVLQWRALRTTSA